MTRRFFSAVLFSVLTVTLSVLTGCGISNVTTTLQLVIAAAEAALGALGNTTYSGWLRAISQAVSFAATELASTDSSTVKAEKIISQFLAIAAPILPAGTPQTIVLVIQAVITAVENFLTAIQPAAPPASAAAVAKLTGKTATPTSAQISISGKDRTELQAIKNRADALAAKLR